jgi:hypothetical protein
VCSSDLSGFGAAYGGSAASSGGSSLQTILSGMGIVNSVGSILNSGKSKIADQSIPVSGSNTVP